MKKVSKNLINIVDDGFNYFNGYRLEELKEDDKFYINALMTYIENLESRTKELSEQVEYLKSTIKKLMKDNKSII
jgi:regulator of replication initiation timing